MAVVSVESTSALTLGLIVLGSTLCLASYCLRLVYHVVRCLRDREVVGSGLLVAVITLGYLGWGYWAAADPVKIAIPAGAALGAGIPLTAAGMALFVLSELKHRGTGGEALITTGVYARIRHPMYVGLALLHLGYPLIYRSLVVMASTAIWVAFAAVWARFEDRRLEQRFGQGYRDYRKSTWF
jgi:protein-S-isoprenylcysteine O-methyltransferase Ste14